MTEQQQRSWQDQQPLSKKDAKAQAAAAAAYAKSQRSWFARHKILTALGALVLLAIVMSVVSGGGGGDDTGAAGNGSSDSADAPAIVVSAQEMISALEGNALSAKSTYEDKRVTVNGFVGNIDASGDYFALDPEPDAFILTGIQVQTSEEFLDQVAGFTKGQAVTVTGTVTNVGEVMGYSLEAVTID